MTNDTNANLNNGGTGNLNNGEVATMPAFVSQLEGDLQKDERLTLYKDKTLSDFVKDSFKTGEDFKSLREVNEKMIKPLDENATDEERTTFRKAFNVPESIEGYEVQKPENLPEGMVYDEVLADRILNTVHKMNMPKQAVQSLFKEFNDYQIEMHNKFDAYLKEGEQKRLQVLKDEWKDKYDANNKQVQIAITKFAEKSKVPEGFGGMDGFKKWLTDSGNATDPMFNWLWHDVFNLIGDDAYIKGDGLSKSSTGNIYDEFFPSMANKN